MTEIKGIIFDCFGVLLTDSMSAALEVYATGDQHKRDAVWDLVKAANVGMKSSHDVRQEAANILGITPAEWVDAINNGEVRNIMLMDYIKSLRPVYKTALLSNISATGLDRRFSKNELDELFDVVVPSGKYGIAKPDVEIYQLTSQLLGLEPSECIMIDDKEDFCAGAEAAGMSSILYQDFENFSKDINQILVG